MQRTFIVGICLFSQLIGVELRKERYEISIPWDSIVIKDEYIYFFS